MLNLNHIYLLSYSGFTLFIVIYCKCDNMPVTRAWYLKEGKKTELVCESVTSSLAAGLMYLVHLSDTCVLGPTRIMCSPSK